MTDKTLSAAIEKALHELTTAPPYTSPASAYAAKMEEMLSPQDNTPPTREQWEKLYEVAEKIFQLKPWEYLHESDNITILLPGRDEPMYMVTMGIGEVTYGVGIYPGYISRNALRKIETDASDGVVSAAFEQHCINLYFGNREELEPDDRKIIKDLGLKFRGKNRWPHFRSMIPGFIPWVLNYSEAELAIQALQNYVMAFVAYAKGTSVDFENGETLLRFFAPELDMWINVPCEMPPVPIVTPRLQFRDDLTVAALKKKKKTAAKLSAVVSYLPAPIQENKNERPRLPLVAMLMDMSSGMIEGHAMEMTREDIGGAAVEMLVDYISQHGRPQSIDISDEFTHSILADFVSKVGIKQTQGDKSLAMNMIMEMMIGMGGGGQFGEDMF